MGALNQNSLLSIARKGYTLTCVSQNQLLLRQQPVFGLSSYIEVHLSRNVGRHGYDT
jgi:hypothetical protein